MTALLSASATMLERVLAQLSRPTVWPDPASGFAFRLLTVAGIEPPAAYAAPLRPAGVRLFRRAPDLAGFGYVMDRAEQEVREAWHQGFVHLTGRDVFPADRSSFIYNPLELMGVTYGAVECPFVTDPERAWLAGAILKGIGERQLSSAVSQVAATSAARLLGKVVGAGITDFGSLQLLGTGELLLQASFAMLVPGATAFNLTLGEREVITRVLSTAVPVHDLAEAAGLYVVLKRAVDRETLTSDVDALAKLIALCRRFPLFVERVGIRQRSRPPVTIVDEYDVQDFLHAILKLHFDDVRPEEWTPSYAGSSSRVDFFLPRERTVVEAKMVRSGLGQKEIANELIIDRARYALMPQVDNLICLVYDPSRRCTNPSALENDVSNHDGRLRVTVVVCPRVT